MEIRRHKGYVMGFDNGARGKRTWKVRVKDPTSPHDGKKFVVASTHGNLELAQGLNVNFAIGTVDDEEGQKVERAVDVRLD